MYKRILKNKGILNISEYHHTRHIRHMPAKPAIDFHLCSIFPYFSINLWAVLIHAEMSRGEPNWAVFVWTNHYKPGAFCTIVFKNWMAHKNKSPNNEFQRLNHNIMVSELELILQIVFKYGVLEIEKWWVFCRVRHKKCWAKVTNPVKKLFLVSSIWIIMI